VEVEPEPAVRADRPVWADPVAVAVVEGGGNPKCERKNL